MLWSDPLTFVNAVVVDGTGRVWDSIRIRGRAVDALGEKPHKGDRIIDVQGGIIAPGLINAHDHLELNSFARLKWRPRYQNVREWIADFQPRFASDPELAAARPDNLADRLWVGGLKNLLAGVTTVCHHNPIHRPLRRRFPTRIVTRCGIGHSLQIDGTRLMTSYARTPASWPWIVHAAEGIDMEARSEVEALDRMKCLGANTVLVHGVGLDDDGTARVLRAGASLVWCPSSNHFLFGRTALVERFSSARRLALGTDSRLSGERDLLDELRVAAQTRQVSSERLFLATTRDAARVFRLAGSGQLMTGAPADLVIVNRRCDDPYDSMVQSSRADVRLTMKSGDALYGDVELRPVFRWRSAAEVTVDGAPRLLATWIARRARQLVPPEPGLEIPSS
jgi:cytosine/adenosine deaminase-related metal-dependent hydrolase